MTHKGWRVVKPQLNQSKLRYGYLKVFRESLGIGDNESRLHVVRESRCQIVWMHRLIWAFDISIWHGIYCVSHTITYSALWQKRSLENLCWVIWTFCCLLMESLNSVEYSTFYIDKSGYQVNSFLIWNICCGYSLEVPHWGTDSILIILLLSFLIPHSMVSDLSLYFLVRLVNATTKGKYVIIYL